MACHRFDCEVAGQALAFSTAQDAVMAAGRLWAALAVDKYSSGGIYLESSVKMVDGFLVPKDAEKKDVFDAVTSVLPMPG